MIQIAHLTYETPNDLMDAVCEAAGVDSRRDTYEMENIETVTIDGVDLTINLVYQEGGGEGEGEYVERVYEIKHGGQHVCFLRDQGHYESYNGTEMNGEFKEVFPQQVTVTRYAELGKKAHV